MWYMIDAVIKISLCEFVNKTFVKKFFMLGIYEFFFIKV